jgi:hypothetical protein
MRVKSRYHYIVRRADLEDDELEVIEAVDDFKETYELRNENNEMYIADFKENQDEYVDKKIVIEIVNLLSCNIKHCIVSPDLSKIDSIILDSHLDGKPMGTFTTSSNLYFKETPIIVKDENIEADQSAELSDTTVKAANRDILNHLSALRSKKNISQIDSETYDIIACDDLYFDEDTDTEGDEWEVVADENLSIASVKDKSSLSTELLVEVQECITDMQLVANASYIHIVEDIDRLELITVNKRDVDEGFYVEDHIVLESDEYENGTAKDALIQISDVDQMKTTYEGIIYDILDTLNTMIYTTSIDTVVLESSRSYTRNDFAELSHYDGHDVCKYTYEESIISYSVHALEEQSKDVIVCEPIFDIKKADITYVCTTQDVQYFSTLNPIIVAIKPDIDQLSTEREVVILDASLLASEPSDSCKVKTYESKVMYHMLSYDICENHASTGKPVLENVEIKKTDTVYTEKKRIADLKKNEPPEKKSIGPFKLEKKTKRTN